MYFLLNCNPLLELILRAFKVILVIPFAAVIKGVFCKLFKLFGVLEDLD